MGKVKQRVILASLVACLSFAAVLFAKPVTAVADASVAGASINDKLIVKYGLDETATGNGAKLEAQKWDVATQTFVTDANAQATIVNSVVRNWGTVTGAVSSVDGAEGKALSFTQQAYAWAKFKLPADATGMTVSLWVKNINTYWASLVEFWDGANGGRFGRGTMQGNGGRSNAKDPWSSNCSAHDNATFAEGGGWDSFVIAANSNDNGGASVDPMVANKWYWVTYVITSTEMKAYRNGVLKQTFNKGNSATILQSILTAAKSDNGKLGIRLSHDSSDNDILDDLRIYSYPMTEADVKEAYPSSLALAMTTVPEYYDVTGVGYPEELLFDGATSLTTSGNIKSGVTAHGVTYSYQPLTVATTPANDRTGMTVTCSKDGYEYTATMKFRRTLKIEAESLGYKIGSGASVAVPVPQNAGEDIIVKVAENVDLTNITAGTISVKRLAGDNDGTHYSSKFAYNAKTQTAIVRCGYTAYPLYDTIYTIKFVKWTAETFVSMSVTGGKTPLTLTKGDFAQQNAVNVEVRDLNDFTLTATLSLAEGASLSGAGGSNAVTFTKSDLIQGKLTLTVTNTDGASVTYYLVPFVRSSDATLSALTATPYTLNFVAGTTEYALAVNKGEGIKVYNALTATANDRNASVKKTYDLTEKKITLVVTAENGDVRNYVITITEQDTDATLKEILQDGAAIENFDPEKRDYTVKYAGDPPVITATANSTFANAPVVSAADQDGKITITVTAQNGETRNYTVTLAKKSGDASLKKLALNGTEIAFENKTAEYCAPIGTRVANIVVTAQTEENARVLHKIKTEENQVVVTVIAEDGTEENYVVNVVLQPYTVTGSGETIDNSPRGCASSLDGGATITIATTLSAGAWLFFKRKRKTQ